MKTTTKAGIAMWGVGTWWMLLCVSALTYLATGHSYDASRAASFVTLSTMAVSSGVCFWGGYLLLKGKE